MKLFGVIAQVFSPFRSIILYHHGASGVQKSGEQTQKADQAKSNQLTNASQGTLSQFEGPVQQSPFYKALLTSGTEATSNAYGAAQANQRQRANMAGFGYNQPVEQGASDQLGAQEAGAMAALPGQAMLEAAGPAMQAAGQTGSMGMGYGQQGLGYYGDVSNQDINRQKSGLYNQLWTLGDTIAGGVGQGVGKKIGGN